MTKLKVGVSIILSDSLQAARLFRSATSSSICKIRRALWRASRSSLEPYVAVLPVTHACAGQKSISPGILRNEPFVYYPRTAGGRAFEKPLTLFEEYGFRPQIVQEATHWLTVLLLVEA